MKNLKLKVITGFREDQFYTIDSEEAHKAYYLFLNPEERGIFSNGVALIGRNIQGIEPDYHATMGWNPSHKLDDYDWQELNQKKIPNQIRDILEKAKVIAIDSKINLNILKMPLSKVSKNLSLDNGYIK